MDKKHLAFVQQVLDSAVAEKAVAGASCLVFQGGKEQGYFDSGMADIARGKKFRRDTICRMYSMTKPVTSAAVWSLVEEGRLELGDELSRYLPEFAGMQVCDGWKVGPAARAMTIRDLLNMTSGLSYGGAQDEAHRQTSLLLDEMNAAVGGDAPITTQDFVRRLAAVPLGFEPGTDYEYGLSADVLGAVVEKVTGMSYGEYLRIRFFEPLGMEDTAFFVPAEKIDRLAEEYARTADGELAVYDRPNLGVAYRAEKSPVFESGGAGLLSTADDYMKFCRMLLSGGRFGRKQILKERTVQHLRTQHISAAVQRCFDARMPHLSGYSYGSLCRILVEPAQSRMLGSAGEFGWDGWLGTFMLVDPANDLALVYLMQRTDCGLTPMSCRIKNIVYAAL